MIHLERNMTLNSSRDRGHHVLGIIPAAKAEHLLTALANLPGDWPLIQNPEAYKRTESAIRRIQSRHADAFADLPSIALIVCRDLARKAWTLADARSAEWYLFRLRYLHSETVRRVRAVQQAAKLSAKPDREFPTIPGTIDEAMRTIAESEPPPITELEAAAFYLQTNLRRALYCPNTECPAPYFFASKKGQK